MSLTADQFMEIISSLKSDTTGRRTAEKRSAPRVGMRDRVSVRFRPHEPGSAAIAVGVRDLSTTGICIVHTHMIPPGAQFIAQFPTRSNRPLSVLYTVAHCKSLSKTCHYVGAKLSRIYAEPAEEPQAEVPSIARAPRRALAG